MKSMIAVIIALVGMIAFATDAHARGGGGREIGDLGTWMGRGWRPYSSPHAGGAGFVGRGGHGSGSRWGFDPNCAPERRMGAVSYYSPRPVLRYVPAQPAIVGVRVNYQHRHVVVVHEQIPPPVICVSIPSFVGLSEADARTRAAQLGLLVESRAEISGRVPPGWISGQNLAVGANVPRGSTVILNVAVAPPPPPTPAVRESTPAPAAPAPAPATTPMKCAPPAADPPEKCETPARAVNPEPRPTTLEAKLHALMEAHKKGLVSDEEYAAARTQLLSDL